MNDYEIIKKAVAQANIESASKAGEIKGKISILKELGLLGDTQDTIIDEANKYLDEQEQVLEKQEKSLESQKQKIINKYSEIIKTTAPGVEND